LEMKRQHKEYFRTVSDVSEGRCFRTTWSHVPISFTQADLRLQHYPHNDPLVIRANIGKNSVHFTGNDVGRILVDNGSSADILVWQCFVKTGFTETALKKSQYPLIGFGGKRIEALGKIELNVTFGEGAAQRTEVITFDVVDINYPYNAIFGHNTLVKFAAVIHQSYLCMKLPSTGGVVMVYSNQEEARWCEDNASTANKNVHVIETPNEDNEVANSEEPEKSGGYPRWNTRRRCHCAKMRPTEW